MGNSSFYSVTFDKNTTGPSREQVIFFLRFGMTSRHFNAA